MTPEEVAAVQQRTRDEWAKYQKAAEKAPRRFQAQNNEKEGATNE